MARFLAILDTWLVMTAATLFLWLGMAGVYARTDGTDSLIGLLGGVAGICLAGALCYWRGPQTQTVLLLLRLAMIACLAYFVWFQGRPWFVLDDSAFVRGSFRQEFLLQRMEQVGGFLLVVAPMIALGVWHGRRLLPRTGDQPFHDRRGVALLSAFVLASVGSGVVARLVGVPKLGPLFWVFGAMAISLLLFEFARRVSKAEFPAVIAFAVFAFSMPVVLLWP
jgi:hypothetical protein